MIEVLSDVPHEVRVTDLSRMIDAGLSSLNLPAEPRSLYEPVRYILGGGGKRLRPVLVLLTGEVFGVPHARALPAALAVEVFHNFTLVHDDIMDHARERRGRPTVHVRWDESTAILSGDFMMALSYDLLAQVQTPHLSRLVRTFHAMVARLCEGQMLDKAFEERADVTVNDYLDMIERKTGALLEAVLEIGGIMGEAPDDVCMTLRSIGKHLGRAFQIQDDLLDVTATDAQWGKVIGGDLIEGKKTFLLLRALETVPAAEKEWFRRIVAEKGLPADEVPIARSKMAEFGILEEARRVILDQYAQACEGLAVLPRVPAVETMRWLIQRMQARVH